MSTQRWPTTAHILERAGCQLHYWLTGADERPLIVLTHGLTLDHRMFDPQVEALAGEYGRWQRFATNWAMCHPAPTGDGESPVACSLLRARAPRLHPRLFRAIASHSSCTTASVEPLPLRIPLLLVAIAP